MKRSYLRNWDWSRRIEGFSSSVDLSIEDVWRSANAYRAIVKELNPVLWVLFQGALWRAEITQLDLDLHIGQYLLVVDRLGNILYVQVFPEIDGR